MRVDNDWENGIGKKLFDLEGEVSPDAWKNINQRIQPPRKSRYRYIPALLALLLVPTAVLVTDPLNWLQNDEKTVALEPQSQQTALPENAAPKTVGLKPEKPVSAISEMNQSEIQNAEISSLNTGQVSERTAVEGNDHVAHYKPKTGKETSVIALSSNTKTVRPVAETEEKNRKQSEFSKQNSAANPVDQVAKNAMVSGGKTEHTLAKNKAANRKTENNSNQALALNASAKTVGSGIEKTEASGIESTSGTAENRIRNAAGNSNFIEQNGIKNPEKTASEIAALPLKNDLFPDGFSVEDFLETLPDSVKKVLVKGLPEPEFSGEKKNQQPARTKPGHWAFAVYGGPQYAFQRMLPNTQDDISILALKNKNALETERLGYEFGFRANYEVRKNLELVFGFQATQISQHLRLEITGMQPDSVSVVQSSNAVTMQVFHTAKQENYLFKYYFGGLFTGLNLRVSEKMDLSGGVGTNWLLQTKTLGEQVQVPTSTFNPYLNLGLQYKHPLSRKLTFTAGPAMQYYLKPVQSEQAFIGMKPTTIAFNVGFKYKP